MDCWSRRQMIAGASLGVGAPLLVEAPAHAAPAPVIRTSKVPVGGGVVVARREVVVTQPRAGRFRVFTAICTHHGCTVGSVADGRITCPCHGGQYSISSGAVLAGPPPRGLAARAFEIRRGRIYLT